MGQGAAVPAIEKERDLKRIKDDQDDLRKKLYAALHIHPLALRERGRGEGRCHGGMRQPH
jgi:hypothetical protein